MNRHGSRVKGPDFRAVGGLQRHFEVRQELMLTQLKERVTFAALDLLQVEHILITLHRGLHIIDNSGGEQGDPFDCRSGQAAAPSCRSDRNTRPVRQSDGLVLWRARTTGCPFSFS